MRADPTFVALVTGATSGIGRAAALALAHRGGSVVLLSRDPDRGERVADALRHLSGNPDVTLLPADLSRQREVRRAAAAFIGRFDRLDILINNAGIMLPQRRLSDDGIEMTLAVNHLAPFLLTDLLLGRLRQTPGARIVNVGSDAHVDGRIDFDDLQMTRGYGSGVGMRAYANAKLANLLTTYHLARQLDPARLTVNAVHPGYVDTGIVRIQDATGAWRLLKPFWRLMMKAILTPAQGAAPLVDLACSPAYAGVNGRYFDRFVTIPSAPASYNPALQQRMWAASERLVAASA